MAGFVAILRQLGDLAQLASEVFHELHEQAAAASARGHHLAERLRRLEDEMPLVEKHFSGEQRCLHLHAACTTSRARLSWRANLKLSHGIVSDGNGNGRPRFIVQHIQRCRGPPKLSMLDKFDAAGEGACLRRYTNPSFFRTHSQPPPPKISSNILSSNDSKLPKAPLTCSKSQTDTSDKASDGFFSMFRRRLKYRQTNGPACQGVKPETQSQNFHKEDSSAEQRSIAKHHPKVNTPSTASPESRIQMAHVAVGAASISEDKTCDLGRTSSFEAWLSPESEITEEAPHSNFNGFVSYVTSNGAPAASPSESSGYRGGVEFITSRVSKFPRKIFVKKHDPLASSFRNIAKNLLQLKYDAIRENESYGFERDSEDYDAKCLEMSQCDSVDETKEDSNATERDPSDLAHDSCEHQPDAATDTVHSPADGDDFGRCKLAAVSPRFRQELLALASASDGPSSPNSLDYQTTDRPARTMKVSDMATEKSRSRVPSEDVPDLDEVVLDDKSAECMLEQLISDAAIVSSPGTSKQFAQTCEACPRGGKDEDASGSGVSCNPETIPKETCVPLLVANPVFSCHTSVPDSERCCLHPETTSLTSTTGPTYDASVDGELQGLHQSVRHQEQNGSAIPYVCSSSRRSPENSGYYTSTPDTRDLFLPSTPSSRCVLDESVHEQAVVRPGNVCSQDTKDGTVPPLPPMQWLSVKVNTAPGIASPKLTALTPKSPVIKRTAKRDSLVRTQKTAMTQTSSQHNLISQADMARVLACKDNGNVDITHVDGVYRNSFLGKDSDEISPQESFIEDQLRLSEGKILKDQGEREDFYRKATKISPAHGATFAVSEFTGIGQVDVQNSAACQSNQYHSSNVNEGNVFFSALEQLKSMSPPSVPRPEYSLVEVGSQDRSTLKMPPIMIYPPRKLSGERSILLEQIKEKSLNLKPVSGRSTNVMISPRNSKVATILQRADDIRQAHVDNNEIDSEDSWSESD